MWLRNVNPVLKFLGFIAIFAAIFIKVSFFFQTIMWVSLTVLYFSNGLSWKKYGKIGWAMVVIFAIFFFFNWLILKAPIAIHLDPDSLLVGNDDILYNASAGYIWYHNGGTNISRIWGGINPIVLQPTGLTYAGHTWTLPDIVFNQNYIPQGVVTHTWMQTSAVEQKEMLTWAHGNKQVAQAFDWMIRNNWTLYPNQNDANNDVDALAKLQGAFVKNPDFALPGQGFAYASKWYSLSPAAISFNLYMTMKVYLIILSGAILTFTTSGTALAFGIAKILTPLRWIRIPVNEIAMMIAMALNFIPLLVAERRQIMMAQANRGCDYHTRNIVTKTRALSSMVVPLFTTAFYHVENISLAMEARGYRPLAKMTSYRSLALQWLDLPYFLISFGLLAISIAFAVVHLTFTPFGVFEIACITR